MAATARAPLARAAPAAAEARVSGWPGRAAAAAPARPRPARARPVCMARKGGGRGGKGGGRSDARDRFLSAGGALDLLSEAPAPQRARQREQGQEQQQRARKQQGKASKTASRRNALRESIKHNPIQVGKSGLTDGLCKRVDDYLERYELCKVKVLDTSPDGLADVAAELSERLGAKVVLTIGRVATLERSRLVEGGKRRGGGARQKASRVDPKIWSKDVLWSVHLPFERFAELGEDAHEDEEGSLGNALAADSRTVTHEIEGGARRVHEMGEDRDGASQSLEEMFNSTPWLSIVEEDGSVESRF